MAQRGTVEQLKACKWTWTRDQNNIARLELPGPRMDNPRAQFLGTASSREQAEKLAATYKTVFKSLAWVRPGYRDPQWDRLVYGIMIRDPSFGVHGDEAVFGVSAQGVDSAASSAWSTAVSPVEDFSDSLYDVCVDVDKLPTVTFRTAQDHGGQGACAECRRQFKKGDAIRIRPCLHILCQACAGQPNCRHGCTSEIFRSFHWGVVGKQAQFETPFLIISGVAGEQGAVINGTYEFHSESSTNLSPIFVRRSPRLSEDVWIYLSSCERWVVSTTDCMQHRLADNALMFSSKVKAGTAFHAAQGWEVQEGRGYRLARGVRIDARSSA